jgi:ATP adenylyltransferase
MPVKVLKRHGAIESDGKLVTLAVSDLIIEQKANIRMLCEQRLQVFVQGLSIWDYRMLDDDPVPDSLRFLALKVAGGRCQLCGVTKNERPLYVDYILPRARGGKNDLANLQVLCSKCNRSKRVMKRIFVAAFSITIQTARSVPARRLLVLRLKSVRCCY